MDEAIKISDKETLQETLKKIGQYMLDGLSESEACILVNVDIETFKKIKEINPGVKLFLKKKEIEFKHNHLKTINQKSSDKNSQWILENLRPDDFGGRKKGGGDVNVNILSAVLKEIQNDHDNNKIIKEAEATETSSDSSTDTRGTSIELVVAEVLH